MSTTRPRGFTNAEQFRQLLGGMPQSTFERAIRSGLIPPPIKIGRARNWPDEDVDETLERFRQQRTPA